MRWINSSWKWTVSVGSRHRGFLNFYSHYSWWHRLRSLIENFRRLAVLSRHVAFLDRFFSLRHGTLADWSSEVDVPVEGRRLAEAPDIVEQFESFRTSRRWTDSCKGNLGTSGGESAMGGTRTRSMESETFHLLACFQERLQILWAFQTVRLLISPCRKLLRSLLHHQIFFELAVHSRIYSLSGKYLKVWIENLTSNLFWFSFAPFLLWGSK